MSVPFIKNSWVSGEVAPSFYGRTDNEHFSTAASTLRNSFVGYRGNTYSRGGGAFVGYSRQTAPNLGSATQPPRLIPFQFNINQGLVLEFGDYYMCVIANGNYVTEGALNIGGISQADPALVTLGVTGATAATALNTTVTSSYSPGDLIAPAGGVYVNPSVFTINSTELLALTVLTAGSNYAPNDTIHLTGGTYSTQAIATVATTTLSATPVIVSPGTGGTPGTATVTGTTGTGTKFQLNVTITAGLAATVNTGAVTGSYAPGDTITLAGGTYNTPASVTVSYTVLKSLTLATAGSGYAPTDTITIGGALITVAPVVTVLTTQVVGTPGIVSAGSGGTAGTQTVTGTTGTGTKFQASVTVTGGAITAVNSVTVAGVYTVNPSNLNNEPVTGAGLSGAALSIKMGVNTFSYTLGGNFTNNPTGNVLYQLGTSGSGLGATFAGIFAPGAVTFSNQGVYSAFPSNPVAQGGTSGNGFGATFTVANATGITAINSITVSGAYTANPANLSAEPVTGGGLTGATVSLQMGVATVSISTPGVFTVNPPGGVMAQGTTSGSGSGATFGYALMGPDVMTLQYSGTYTTFPTSPAAQYRTSGTGVGAQLNLSSAAASPYGNGDYVFIQNAGGMTEVNGRIFAVLADGTTGFYLYDAFGIAINSTGYPAYTSGGTASRIYALATPYAAADLKWLKWTQSADVVSLCCVNQDTGTEYAPMDLVRLADNNWTIAPTAFGTTLGTPTNLTDTNLYDDNSNPTGYVIYYAVTSVDSTTGEESPCSIEIGAGNEPLGTPNKSGSTPTNVLNWAPVAGASYYNVYKETPVPFSGNSGTKSITAPTLTLGFIGQTASTSFSDTNISPDFTQTPPQHQNPFARGQIVTASVTAGGSGYQWANGVVQYSTINTSTGAGGQIVALYTVPNHNIGQLAILNAGYNYTQGDTITIVGSGSGAAGVLTIGPQSGTYPGTVAYFQERRVYAASLNNPDTYWMSKAGLYLNFDTSFPPVSSDAITGSPWAVAVDGIQWMLNMPGGLVVFTGTGAWQLTGAGGSSLNPQPVTPSDEQAQPQGFTGCSATLPPIKIIDSILFGEAKNSNYYEITYQYFTNIYTPTDLTQLSSHLFQRFEILEHAWCNEPYKILWAVRNDGVLLSLTYLKSEEVSGWARHDTNGLFVSVCSVTEKPVDALYTVVYRVINGQPSYMVERMDNRIWNTVEDVWAVDAGLSLPLDYPQITGVFGSAYGDGLITGSTGLVGGTGYSAGTTATIIDQGPGAGATASLTIVAGVITGITITNGGANYQYPSISFSDPENTGAGASATLTLQNHTTFTVGAAAFTSGNIGMIIRGGGAIAQVISIVSGYQATVNLLQPVTETYPNSGTPAAYPIPRVLPPGGWTIATPTTTVGGLWHLAGAYVTGLADGNVITPRQVSAAGTITLDAAASAVTVGLGFTAQAQTVYFNAGQGQLSQGRRKGVSDATIRVELSRGLQIGTNQPDGATLSPIQIDPAWNNMVAVPDRRIKTYNGYAAPLYTGDIWLPVPNHPDTRGQVAVQQIYPLPMTILAVIPGINEGDLEAGKGGSTPASGGGAGPLGTGFYFPPAP